MIGRGIFTNPYCFTDHTPTREELMELLNLHLNLHEEYTNKLLRSIRDDGSERGGDEKAYSHIPPYEPLKHFFKIYINNFPGAKELRAKLMETHSITEARQVLSRKP